MGLWVKWKTWLRARHAAALAKQERVRLLTPRDDGWRIVRVSPHHQAGHEVPEYWDMNQNRWRILHGPDPRMVLGCPSASRDLMAQQRVPGVDRVGPHRRQGLVGEPPEYEGYWPPPTAEIQAMRQNGVPGWLEVPRWNGRMVFRAKRLPGSEFFGMEAWDTAARAWRVRPDISFHDVAALPQADNAILDRLGVPRCDRPSSVAWMITSRAYPIEFRVVRPHDGNLRVELFDEAAEDWRAVPHEAPDGAGEEMGATGALPDPQHMMADRQRVRPADSWLLAPRELDGLLFRLARAGEDDPLAVKLWDSAFSAWLRVPEGLHDAVVVKPCASDPLMDQQGVPPAERDADHALWRVRDWDGRLMRLTRPVRGAHVGPAAERWHREAARWIRLPIQRPSKVLQAPLATPAQLAAAGVAEAPATPVQER